MHLPKRLFCRMQMSKVQRLGEALWLTCRNKDSAEQFFKRQEKPKAEQMTIEAWTLPTRSGCHWQAELAMDHHQALKFSWRTLFFFFCHSKTTSHFFREEVWLWNILNCWNVPFLGYWVLGFFFNLHYSPYLGLVLHHPCERGVATPLNRWRNWSLDSCPKSYGVHRWLD